MRRIKSREEILQTVSEPDNERSLCYLITARIMGIIFYFPLLFFRKVYKQKPIKLDMVYHHQKQTMGLLEDIQMVAMQCTEEVGNLFRSLIRFQFGNAAKHLMRGLSLFKPQNFLSKKGIDQRTQGEIIQDFGYPYENHQVTTDDGYILSLDRIPREDSNKVIFFQHGIMDSSYTWIATEQAHSMALQAYDQGFDVFMGNFRGFAHSLKHKDPQIQNNPSKFWDYSFNEHAFCDIKAFIEKIRSLKKEEHKIIAVAHSMGGGSIMAYIVNQKLQKKEHYLSKAILLAPAGVHKEKVSFFKWIGFKILQLTKLLHIPIYYLGFTSETTKILAEKILQDIKNHAPIKALASWFVSQFVLGGNVSDNPIQYVHNLVYHSFNGTSLKVLDHFYQMHYSNQFLAYDYGEKKNLEIYGQKTPINFLDNYDKIDIPIHIIYSKKDNIIPEECCLAHYYAMMNKCPDLARVTRFDELGHIELTMNTNTTLIDHVLDLIKEKKEVDLKRDDFYKSGKLNLF